MNKTFNWTASSQSREKVFIEMDKLRKKDFDWHDLQNLTASYFGGHDVAEIAKEAFCRHIGDNAVHQKGLHPSVSTYEREVLEMVFGLFNAPNEASGTITTGGSESIMLALKTARDQARAEKPEINVPELVVPQSAYAVFNKACHLLGIKLVQMSESPDFRADVAGMKEAVNENTIMMVGSAPPFPYGLVDPIPELAAIAKAHKIWFHVDACIGGFVLPFARDLGEVIPDFDFSVEGVTSISCDFHKYGYAYRGCSVLLLRNAELEQYQGFSTETWPAGDYYSKNVAGSRNSGPIASAWAVMKYLGYEGYLEIIRQLIASRQKFFQQIEASKSAQLLGRAEGPHFAFTVGDVDIHRLLANLMTRGWRANLGTKPDSVLLMLSHHHGQIAEKFGQDLNSAIEEARSQAPVDHDAQVYSIY
ncbi:MAG: aspartate aminotransferase family protein [SAR324 cluster bacterium]|nr:aspartate aminotransferase family protein [SAR324 cluster bacterium]